MLVRYKYKMLSGNVVGCYECEVEDFKKLWKMIGNSVVSCSVDMWDKDRGKWSVCDCWYFNRVWKLNGWYNKGWKLLSGI